uniref:DDE_Tnp_1_7 domain-containing protein n=1 Tax=Macrostomum lignano TaxID=282301 RepID=A0A1I8I7J0_9PLAT
SRIRSDQVAPSLRLQRHRLLAGDFPCRAGGGRLRSAGLLAVRRRRLGPIVILNLHSGCVFRFAAFCSGWRSRPAAPGEKHVSEGVAKLLGHGGVQHEVDAVVDQGQQVEDVAERTVDVGVEIFNYETEKGHDALRQLGDDEDDHNGQQHDGGPLLPPILPLLPLGTLATAEQLSAPAGRVGQLDNQQDGHQREQQAGHDLVQHGDGPVVRLHQACCHHVRQADEVHHLVPAGAAGFGHVHQVVGRGGQREHQADGGYADVGVAEAGQLDTAGRQQATVCSTSTRLMANSEYTIHGYDRVCGMLRPSPGDSRVKCRIYGALLRGRVAPWYFKNAKHCEQIGGRHSQQDDIDGGGQHHLASEHGNVSHVGHHAEDAQQHAHVAMDRPNSWNLASAWCSEARNPDMLLQAISWVRLARGPLSADPMVEDFLQQWEAGQVASAAVAGALSRFPKCFNFRISSPIRPRSSLRRAAAEVPGSERLLSTILRECPGIRKSKMEGPGGQHRGRNGLRMSAVITTGLCGLNYLGSHASFDSDTSSSQYSTADETFEWSEDDEMDIAENNEQADQLFEDLSNWTNAKAWRIFQEAETEAALPKQVLKWRDSTTDEVRNGIVLLMGVDKKPEIANYWSTDPAFHCSLLAKPFSLSRDRFKQLLSCLRFYNCAEALGDGPLAKMEPFLHSVNNQFGEGLGCQDLTMSEKVVAELCRSLLNLGHHVFTDSWFKSQRLATWLLQHDTLLTGTVRKNRGIPAELQAANLHPTSSAFARSGDLLACKFVDRKQSGIKTVYLLDTAGKAYCIQVHRTRRGGAVQVVPKPVSVLAYCASMGGVDHLDASMHPYLANRKSMRWFHKLGFHLFLMLVRNAWVIFKQSGGTKTFLQFIRLAVKYLLEDTGVARRRGRMPDGAAAGAGAEAVGNGAAAHSPSKAPRHRDQARPRKRCRVCYAAGQTRGTRRQLRPAPRNDMTAAVSPLPDQPDSGLGRFASDDGRPMRRTDFARVGACGAALLLHGFFLACVGSFELAVQCVRVRTGLALLVGIGDLGLGGLCLVLCSLQTLRRAAGWSHRLAVLLGLALLCLTTVYIACFYSLLLGGASLRACSSAVQLLLGSPTITCLIVGVPATFLPLVIVWSHRKGLAAEGRGSAGLRAEGVQQGRIGRPVAGGAGAGAHQPVVDAGAVIAVAAGQAPQRVTFGVFNHADHAPGRWTDAGQKLVSFLHNRTRPALALMFSRSGKGGGFFSSGQLWKSKNPHSLEYLKYLYGVLCKNQNVTEQNRSLVVEALRSMSEILIWGDQNDDTVFDFFLEKSLLSFFLNYMKQKSGQFICVQLLQTLSILFENISKESSVYYLLSNNHVNSIICQKFDFNDEEVMAYYISFLKTLSLKLNKHTIHFFYNEHTNDFALYTEAIKFFNHPESMVRIAVRTITLNVYRVDDKAMMRYIREKSAGPYFSNLVWVMGSHALEMDACIRSDHTARARLADLVSEHLDQLHYIGDVLRLGIEALNATLTDYLVDGLLLPLTVRSLLGGDPSSASTSVGVNRSLAAYLLAHLYLAVHHPPLCRRLLDAALTGLAACRNREFVRPAESLAEALDKRAGRPRPGIRVGQDGSVQRQGSLPDEEAAATADLASSSEDGSGGDTFEDALDDVPQQLAQTPQSGSLLEALLSALEAAANSADSVDADSFALHSLGLLHSLARSPGLHGQSIERVVSGSAGRLAEALLKLLASACQGNSRIRLATAELAAELIDRLATSENAEIAGSMRQQALLDSVSQASTLGVQLRFRSGDDLFLDLFEDELARLKPVNLELLLMDSSLLLAPAATPMSGIDDFARRLPCGEVERSRRSVRLFLTVRRLYQRLASPPGVSDADLPLGGPAEPVRVADSLDLNNSDLIGCRVEREAGRPVERRFLVVDAVRHQAMLVEPDSRRLGWGVVKFVGYLQHVEAASDREDSRCLHVTFHNPGTAPYGGPRPPLLAAKFIFDDHIRCMAARQRLVKGRQRVRREKSVRLAALLGLAPANSASAASTHAAAASASTAAAAATRPRREKRLSASRNSAAASPPASLVGRPSRASGSAAATAAATATFTETCLLSPAEADRID